MSSKPASSATFDDLLNSQGFTSSSQQSQSNRPIGELRKAEEMKQMDPETAAVYEWAHGKERNLRALLCSLDSVIWEGSRWTKCGMHQVRRTQLQYFCNQTPMPPKADGTPHPTL